MTPTTLPDWKSRRALIVLALVVTLVAALKLWIHKAPLLDVRLGDSDDAMRLVMVRDLLGGRGWYDQDVLRLQPPLGFHMHWSRLVDGGLAAYAALLRLVAPPAAAEWLMRATWPLLWLLPTVAAGLALTRRLGGGAALSAGALLFMLCAEGYGQFAPGRVDHHNVQIAFCVIAAAGAAWSAVSWRAAALAGAASGLGLAVGIEALPFEAILGAALAVGFVLDPARAKGALAYGLSLAAVSAAAFLIQTPPGRWGAPVCDAMGLNLALGLLLSGAGLSAAVFLTRHAGALARGTGVAAAGLAAAAVFIALDPACLGGPTAAIDPSLRGIWFSNIDEMAPLSSILASDVQRGLGLIAPALLGAIAWAWLGRRPAGRSFEWAMLGACLVVSIAVMAAANRMGSYVVWFAAPLIASAVTEVAIAYGRGLLVSTLGLAVLASPPASAWAAGAVARRLAGRQAPSGSIAADQDACLRTAAFGTLARQPPGLVLAETDLGSFVLAATPHSVLSAPYGVTWGARTTDRLLHLPAEAAEEEARRLGIGYVAACASGGWPAGHGLQARLVARTPPAWLEPISAPADPLQIYRVRPAPLGLRPALD